MLCGYLKIQNLVFIEQNLWLEVCKLRTAYVKHLFVIGVQGW